MNNLKNSPLVIHGWTLFAHPQFLKQVATLEQQVEKLKQKDAIGYKHTNANKRLAAITKLVFEVIPENPSREDYVQGASLGKEYKHWFRAKFFQQYRLFFRYHTPSKIIIIGWVNDENTKRAYDSLQDAYVVFRHMLQNENPPDDWDELLKQVKESYQKR